MTPLDLARTLAKSSNPQDRTEAVAMIARGLSDPSPSDPLRQPWPLDGGTVAAAARYLGVPITPVLLADALALAPTLSDALLNRGAAR